MNHKIVGHCLVKNEENFIWYAIKSVLPYVDMLMIWDNGSTDKTVEIIKTIKSPKIKFEEHPATSRKKIAHLRQEMLDQTPKNYDWLMILDGDEVWGDKQLKRVIKYIHTNEEAESIVVKTYNLVGDIYHRLPKKCGEYCFVNKKGNLALRYLNIKKIPGLHVSNSYGQEGYFDNENKPIQDRQGIAFVNVEYFHATHLLRSSQNNKVIDRRKKLKFYLGRKNDKDKIPKIFFSSKPSIVPTVTTPMNPISFVNSFFQTLLREARDIIKQK